MKVTENTIKTSEPAPVALAALAPHNTGAWRGAHPSTLSRVQSSAAPHSAPAHSRVPCRHPGPLLLRLRGSSRDNGEVSASPAGAGSRSSRVSPAPSPEFSQGGSAYTMDTGKDHGPGHSPANRWHHTFPLGAGEGALAAVREQRLERCQTSRETGRGRKSNPSQQ